MSALSIGRYIYEALRGEIDNVHHVVAPLDTPAPFVLYRRTGVKVEGDRCDDEAFEVSTVDVSVVALSYIEGIELAEKVRKLLKELENRLDVMSVELLNAVEDYADDGDLFLQILTFEIELNK